MTKRGDETRFALTKSRRNRIEMMCAVEFDILKRIDDIEARNPECHASGNREIAKFKGARYTQKAPMVAAEQATPSQ